jgi:hypothetical protein
LAQPEFDRWVDRYAARIHLGEFLQRAGETGAAFLFAFGAVVLAVKLMIPQAWPNVLWGALGLIPACGLAWWLARRNHRSRDESVTRLDSALGSGGLLMMLSELPDSEHGQEWQRKLPQIERAWHDAIPRVRPRRFVSVLALPLLFAVGACFIPLREATTAVAMRNTIGQQATEELAALLKLIDEEKVLDEQEKQKLHEEIGKLADQMRETPLTHEKWETVDALRERLKVRIESAAMLSSEAGAAAEQLSESNSADPTGEFTGEFSGELIESLEKELGEAVQKLIQKGAFSKAPQSLQDQLARLTKEGRLNLPREAHERQEVLDALKEFLERENQKLSELRNKCSACKSGCKGGEGDGDESEAAGQTRTSGAGNKPSRGGVTRGRGDAELTWGDEAEKQGTRFKEVVLPKGTLDQPKDEVLALQRSTPHEDAATDAPRSARRDIEAAAGQATWNRKLNPRYRNAVRKYFDGKPR